MENDGFFLKLSKYLFWDYNIGTLNPNNDINLILERVFTQGTENDELVYFDDVTESNWLSVKLLNEDIRIDKIKQNIIDEINKYNKKITEKL
jgi:hypothetical protein